MRVKKTKTYMGKPCRKCGNEERLVSNNVCLHCNRKNALRHYNNNPEYKQKQLDRQNTDVYKQQRMEYLNDKYQSSKGQAIEAGINMHIKRAEKYGAIPDGTDIEALNNYMVALYQVAEYLEDNTGIRHSIDHIKALSIGGTHSISNLTILPLSMNCSKGIKQMEWAKVKE